MTSFIFVDFILTWWRSRKVVSFSSPMSKTRQTRSWKTQRHRRPQDGKNNSSFETLPFPGKWCIRFKHLTSLPLKQWTKSPDSVKQIRSCVLPSKVGTISESCVRCNRRSIFNCKIKLSCYHGEIFRNGGHAITSLGSSECIAIICAIKWLSLAIKSYFDPFFICMDRKAVLHSNKTTLTAVNALAFIIW